MMIKEQMQRIPEGQREILRRKQPVIDERKREEMERTLSLSLREHVRITVVLWDSLEEMKLSGFVTSIHAHTREIKLQWADEWKWIGLDSILEVHPG